MATPSSRTRRLAWKRWAAALVALLAAIAFGIYWSAGFLDRDPVHLYGMPERPGTAPVAAVFLSGDMGIRYGMGSYVVEALAGAGVPVYAVASSTAFARRQTHAEVLALLTNAIREARRRSGAARVIVIGQSFGADMARVALAALPPALRGQIAALVLVVPGTDAYFRADPLGFAYVGAPDAGAASARALDWLPVTCIRGEDETDSLCPTLLAPNVRRITLPGGHFLRMDHDLLVRTVFAALAPVLGTHLDAPAS
ncbi:virulence protein (VirJ) [Sphingomonas sp. NFR04]|uniref:AcvB/VirJ family lysyl-phosphatidylglycerol hydrolase n=1 Tax=Sphingomonas sp. NFR04 TaxID=1566283 RepID=UPI0008E196D9|nr:AcvB/VirJ family lysyl-phosphatidylglycerol hydrolase [Sphingomonas sp. NFR04]SFI95332.1 virulence protein (VirJ) [Sphingomonas sp. NFR04]